ncbi:YcbK family protein [Ochrobactrum sp. Q0168]|uniref:YcbK family protein n=1 Tax=Ochrobactrum sp. Q0168 TaxID=2793241 RepID=UPI0018EBF27E|nr:YcbK family protein [Ochrobactrum sp. Q0168]
MKFVPSAHRTTGRRFSGSVALLALLLSSCTSTGTGPDGKPLQMTANGSMLTETLQSAADQTVAAEAGAEAKTAETKIEEKPGDAKQAAAAVTAQTPAATPVKENAKNAAMTTTAENTAAEAHPTQVAAAAPEKKSNSLFGLFGGKDTSESKPAEATAPAATTAAASAEKPKSESAEAKPEAAPESAADAKAQPQETAKPAQQEKPVQVASLFGTPKNANAYATPQRPTASQGSISRLFSDESAGSRADRTENKKLAMAKPVSPAVKHEYNYTLPGVRANGGIEIKHRNSLYDDTDIDANEYDDSPNVTLASAPGLARLAPNGLKVQRQTVDVACLKPQLVSMLKTMERHFRRPVMVTSGYRSPSYNRKVNGARKSLHMICAAADIQIDGVSKWEMARFARSMPGRGGVGTYCHTTSIHVDIGPERDWNWKCKG